MAKAKAKKPARARGADKYEQLKAEQLVQIDAHNSMLKRVFDLEEAICPRVAARLTALERQEEVICDRLVALERRVMAHPETAAPYRNAEGYSRLMTDLFKGAPARPANHLTANDRWLVNNMVAIAGSRLTRLARHELIQRLQALNDPG